ncbi:MAG: hypothetical protein KC613_04375 [Myxococcales bacterium]|nr:hypothetical protein [Myxococcales bacterium]
MRAKTFGRLLLTGLLVLWGCDDGGDTGGGGAGGAGGAMVDGGMGDLGGAGGMGGAGGQPPPDMGPGGPVCVTDGDCAQGQFCELPQGAFEGTCQAGCRLQGESQCPERYICTEARRCIPDPNCINDLECPPDQYCADGDCVEGCRLGEDGFCPPLDDGTRTECNPDTRACEPLLPCCDGGGCSFKRVEQCADRPNAEFTLCVNPDPCTSRCEEDGDCDRTEYCGADGLCAEGCRLDDNRACPGQVCDRDTRRCEPLDCVEDAACPDDQYCDVPTRSCRFGCRTAPDNCRGGNFCNAARQCGFGCRNDAQCAERNGNGWYCTPEGECQAPCRADSDCAEEPEERCDPNTQRCEEGCRDDAQEPNNLERDAVALNFGQGNQASLADLRACEQDGDWYRFDTPGDGWTVRATVRFEHAVGDLDAQLTPPGGVPVRGQSSTDNEVMEATGAAGRWTLYVYSRGFDRNAYSVEVELIPPEGGCVPDLAEADGGDNTPATALLVALDGQRIARDIEDRTLCAGEEDWFAVDLGDQDGFTARLSMLGNGDPGGDELDLAVFGPGLPAEGAAPTFLPNAAGGGVNGPRYIEFTAPRLNQQIRAGRYYVRVSGLDADQFGAYALRLAVERARDLCVPDDLEPNDAQRPSSLIAIPGFSVREPGVGDVLAPDRNLILEDRWMCAGDSDWYSFPAVAGDDMVVTVRRQENPLEGDVIVEIRDQGGVVGLPGRSAQPVVVARADNLPAGQHFIRVTGVTPDTQANYQLQINRTAAPIACNVDLNDRRNPNDVRAQATPVAPPGEQGLTLCGRDGDVDWYVFDTQALATLTVGLQFSHARANLELDVFAGDNEVAENADDLAGHSVTDNEQVVLSNRLPGRWYVRVTAVGDRDTSYNLTVNVNERQFICQDDATEPNDAFGDAVDLGDRALQRGDLYLCDRVPAEADTFQLTVPSRRTRTIASTFLYGDDGDLAIEVFDSDQMLVGTTSLVERGNSKQCVVIEPAEGPDRVFFVRLVPLSINRIIQNDERLDYDIVVADGDACDDIGPPAPGVEWPRIP